MKRNEQSSWPLFINKAYHNSIALLVSGGVAGCVAKTVTAPLSRLTILFQVHSMVTTKPHAPQYADSMLAAFRKVVGKEGYLAFWKGNGTSVVHRFPYSAINFTVFESCKTFFSSLTEEADHQNIGANKMGLIRFLSGAVAGGVATATCYPLDLVKTRLTTQAPETPRHYKGILDALLRITKDEGYRGLYNGLGITLLVQIPNLAISYASYGFYRDMAMKWFANQHEVDEPAVTNNNQLDKPQLTESLRRGDKYPSSRVTLVSPSGPPDTSLNTGLQMAVNMGCGALSGISATLIIYPLDVIRRRMQLQGLHRPKELHTNALTEVKVIISQEGRQGLYRGLSPELCKIVPMVSITFCVYELMKDWFEVDSLDLSK